MIPRNVLDRLGDRWTVAVLVTLGEKPLRYTELHLRIPLCSQKMLTQTLRGLEADRLLVRTVYAEVPPRVDYRLTERGNSLLVALQPLEAWARHELPSSRADHGAVLDDEMALRSA